MNEPIVPSAKAPKYSRRSFLVAAGIGAISAPFLAQRGIELLKAAPEVFVTARTDASGKHYISAIDEFGHSRFSTEVELRCHGAAPNPIDGMKAVVFARRPGNLAYEIDFAQGEVRRRIVSPAGRHFYGHGSYSSDGKYLFCSENDIESNKGIVAIYDGVTLERLGEVSSFGVGPHEVRMLSDGKTLVIANGGIITRPDTGRAKLNLDTMQPSLVYLDTQSGHQIGEYRVADHQLSIRHLSVGADDRVGIAMQYEGDKSLHPPLIGFHNGSEQINLIKPPKGIGIQMNNYTASISIEPSSGIACVSSPKGNMISFWQSTTGEFIDSLPIRDAGGVSLSKHQDKFIVTTGAGEIYFIPTTTLKPEGRLVEQNTRWDNHLSIAI